MRTAAARLAAAAIVLAAGGLAACRGAIPDGHAGPPPPEQIAVQSGPSHNANDVAFLQRMITHHEQALELTALVPGHSRNARLTAVAQQVSSQQQTEIAGFVAQLAQWELSPAGRHGPQGTAAAANQAAVDKLKSLHGAAFDQAWLETMIAHSRGTITLTQQEAADGQSPDIIGMAEILAAAQQTQIDQLNRLLGA